MTSARLRSVRSLSVMGAIVTLLTLLVSTAPPSDASGLVLLNVGPNDHAHVSIGVTLPAPSDGSAITTVRYHWTTGAGPWNQSPSPLFTDDYTIDTTTLCVAAQRCAVVANVPTASMPNGTVVVTMAAGNATGTLFTGSARIDIDNPKPVVSPDWPSYADEWSSDGPTSVSYTVTPGRSDTPVTRALLYLDPPTTGARPIAVNDGTGTTFDIDSSTFGPVGSHHVLVMVAQDSDGNYSRAVSQPVLVAPAAGLTSGLADGDSVGTTFDPEIDLPVTAEVPDTWTTPTAEGGAASVQPGIRSMALSVDGGPDTVVPWAQWMTPQFTTPPRSWTYTFRELEGALTAGTHVLRFTASTTYGAVTTISRTVVVSGGASFGQVTYTSGTRVTTTPTVALGTPVTVTVDAKAVDAPLLTAGTAGNGIRTSCSTPTDDGGFHLCAALQPRRPGRYPMWFWVTSPGSGAFNPANPDARREITRTVVVEHRVAARLTGATRSRTGHSRHIYGRVIDTTTTRGVGNLAVLLQRCARGRWSTVGHGHTADDGRADIRLPSHSRAKYRLVVPHEPALVMAAAGPARTF